MCFREPQFLMKRRKTLLFITHKLVLVGINFSYKHLWSTYFVPDSIPNAGNNRRTKTGKIHEHLAPMLQQKGAGSKWKHLRVMNTPGGNKAGSREDGFRLQEKRGLSEEVILNWNQNELMEKACGKGRRLHRRGTNCKRPEVGASLGFPGTERMFACLYV